MKIILQGPTEDAVVAQLRKANLAILSEYKTFTDEEKKKVRILSYIEELEQSRDGIANLMRCLDQMNDSIASQPTSFPFGCVEQVKSRAYI